MERELIAPEKGPLRRFVAVAAPLGLFLVAGVAVGYFGWWLAGRSTTPDLVAGAASADLRFVLPSLDGPPDGPGNASREVVLVDFWATWCSPCHVQAKILAKLYEEVGGRVRFFAVDVGESEETVRAFVDDNPFPYPVLLDEDGEIAAAAGVYGYPTLLIYDRGGNVVYRRSGISSKSVLLEALTAALESPLVADS